MLEESKSAIGRRMVLAGITALVTTNAAAAQATQQRPAQLSERHAAAIENVSASITEWMADRNLPGVSVAVALEGELVWSEGFGWADLEQEVPVTPRTRFRIGSASKALTSVAVGLQLERGALDLDAPVRTYVPGFPEKRWPITVRQLMGHLSGIRHYAGEEPYSAAHFTSVADALDIFAADPLLFEPGTRSSYSSYGWNLVSAALEQVAGRPFLELMRDDVFAPLGMDHTGPDDVFQIVPNRARFYVRDEDDGTLRHERFVDQSNKWAGGGFLSTPTDLVRFGSAMLAHELLDAETLALLWTPVALDSGQETPMGLGWRLAELAGRRMVAAPGSSAGGQTSLILFPEEQLVIAVTSNVTGAELAPIWQALFRGFGGAEVPEG